MPPDPEPDLWSRNLFWWRRSGPASLLTAGSPPDAGRTLPEPTATLDEALSGIARAVLKGAPWTEALSDPRWAGIPIYLGRERGKPSGLWFTRVQAEASIRRSPQVDDPLTGSAQVALTTFGSLLDQDGDVLRHLRPLVRAAASWELPEGVEPVSFEGNAPPGYLLPGGRIAFWEDAPGLHRHGTVPFRAAQGQGLLAYGGRVVLAPEYQEVRPLFLDRVAVRRGEHWGMVDGQGRPAIPCRYLAIGDATASGPVPAQFEDRRWGLLDRAGAELLPPRYSWMESGSGGEWFHVQLDGRWGAIDVDGRCLAGWNPEPFTLWNWNPKAPEDRCILRGPLEPVRFALGDLTGRALTGFDYCWLQGPSEGLVWAAVPDGPGDELFGYLDRDGRVAIPFRFISAGLFSEGLARAFDGRGSGYIDHSGRFVIEPVFDLAGDFAEGLAPVRVRTRKYRANAWGFIDARGAWAIKPGFRCAHPFREGRAAVQREPGGWGYIDRRGAWVVPPRYETARDFQGGVATVARKGAGWGLIGPDGAVRIPCGHAWLDEPEGGLISAHDWDDRYGLLDLDGNVLVPFQYDCIGDARRALAPFPIPASGVRMDPPLRSAHDPR